MLARLLKNFHVDCTGEGVWLWRPLRVLLASSGPSFGLTNHRGEERSEFEQAVKKPMD
jgi:hypothetical protein